MHLSHIQQCTIQNWNVHISVPNGALRDMGQVHCGICELDQLCYPMVSVAHEEVKATHLLSIERADWSKLHDMFMERDSNVWQHEFRYSSEFFMILLT